MKEKKLGRGISALIGDKAQKGYSSYLIGSKLGLVEEIELSKIIAGVYQPRLHFNEEELENLCQSIKENKVIQPIILRKVRDEDSYEIIAGERRYRASKMAGLTTIPAIVKKINNHEALELALIENVQRSDLNAIEEAKGYKKLMNEFSYSQEQISKKIGKSRSHVANLLRLLNLPESIQDKLVNGQISAGHARSLIGKKNAEELALNIIQNSMSVREAEDLSRSMGLARVPANNNRSIVIDDLEDELNKLTNLKVSISHNGLTGKITLKFNDLSQIKELINKLKQDGPQS